MTNNHTQIFIDKFHSRYQGIMAWDDFEDFWQTLKTQSQNWYYYDTQNTPPVQQIDISSKLNIIYKTIKNIHQERYCGLVFVDNLKIPSLVKIFHPNNLGKSCGSSEYPPLPRWVLSKIQPIDIIAKFGKPPKKQSWFKNFISS